MAKWKNFSFRSSIGGNSTWSGGAITDPQDSTQETNVVLPTTTYPTPARDGSSYGRTGGSAPAGTNVTPANAGNDPLLGGYHTAGASNHYQFDVAPGTYDVRLAFAATTTRTVAFLFDGTVSQVIADTSYPSAGFRIWTAGGARTAGDVIVSTIDKGVWLCTAGGTSGTTEPSGAIGSGNFNDNGVIWQRKPRNALAIIDNTPSSTTRVVDQNNVMDLASAWQAKTPLTVTVTGTYGNAMCLMRPQTTSYPRQFSYRVQAFTLAALTVTDELGNNFGTAPTVYCQEPIGLPVLKIVTSNGANFAANFTLLGDLAAYYTPMLIGSSVWLVASAPIPDALAGARSLVVRQTDSDANAPGYFDTNLTVNVVSSQGRPTTGIRGAISTKTHLARKKVKDVTGNRWPGYTGQELASDVAVSGDAALAAAYAALTPNGNSWYRFRVQNGTYTSTTVSFAGDKNFGTGGLLIEPEVGHTPIIRSQLNELHGRGVHVRNLTFAPQSGFYSIYCTLKTAAPFARLRFTGCKIGTLFADPNASWGQWGDFSNLMFHEEFVVEDCFIDGLQNCNVISGGRLFGFINNDYKNVAKDFHALSVAYYNNTPRGVFADDESYCEISGNTARKNPDVYTGLSTAATPHGDWFQFRRFGEGAYGYANYPNGNTSARWALGNRAVNLSENRLYVVSSITTGIADTTVPLSGTGVVVSGGVTFTYDKPYIGGVSFNLLLEDNGILQQGSTVNGPGDATPNVQFVINSNGAFGNPLRVTAINNICASGNSRGLGGGTHINAEYNTFAGPGSSPLEPDIPGILGSGGQATGFIRARRNIIGLNGSNPYILAGDADQKVWSYNNLAVSWKNNPASPNRPSDVFNGPFAVYSTREGYTVNDSAAVASKSFTSQLSKVLHHKLGTHGARLREEYTVTMSDSAGASHTRTLVVSPS